MKNLGNRIDFHTHTIFSDGILLPAAAAREAQMKGYEALGLTDHVDASNLEIVVSALTRFVKEQGKYLPLKAIPGVELSYLPPQLIEIYAKRARKLGAKLIVVHGESPVEPVIPGTNHAAVQLKGLVDILAHPGKISEEDAKAAAKNDIFLELTSRQGHRDGNKHVASMAKKTGARLVVNSDSHSENDYTTQEQAYQVGRDAGLSQEEAIRAIVDNPQELLRRIW